MLATNFFLWNGGIGTQKTFWVSWDDICLPKKKNDLGVKNLEFFNVSLLAKWKWHCLSDTHAHGFEMLSYKYGSSSHVIFYSQIDSQFASLWWRGFLTLNPNSFTDDVALMVGKGDVARFWEDTWFGMNDLCDIFPSLHVLFVNKHILIEDCVVGRLIVVFGIDCSIWNWLCSPIGGSEGLFESIVLNITRGGSLKWCLW